MSGIGYPIKTGEHGNVYWDELDGDQYLVTGIGTDGTRFRLLYSNYSQALGINVYRGTKWLVRGGHRHKISSHYN